MHRIHAPLTRRRFLLSSGAVAAGAAMPRMLFAKTGGTSRLVVVILRGAVDGLSAVPPYGDPDYAGLHRELAIAAPGAVDGALRLDNTFGLHPSLSFLHERYQAGELIVFDAVASPYRERSHFDGQNVLENGLTQPIGTADGWLNRALAALPSRVSGHAAERAVALSQNVPLILRGDVPVLSKSPLATPDVDEDLLVRLADLYSKDDWFSARLSEAVQTEKLTDDSGMTTPQAYDASMSGQSPAQGRMSAQNPAAPQTAAVPAMTTAGAPARAAERVSAVARMATALMRSDGGPEIAVFEASGWDTHANQGGARGTLAQHLTGLDAALNAVADGLGDLWPQTAVLVVTEFGRTAAMNGTRGTDHGTGGCAFLLGGAVQGGRVVADWPGLGQSALLERRDLRPTLDLRSIFKGVLGDHLRIDAKSLAARVFPDSSGARPLQGLIRA
jgi:uncharacterized protein (DUF1501 family)